MSVEYPLIDLNLYTIPSFEGNFFVKSRPAAIHILHQILLHVACKIFMLVVSKLGVHDHGVDHVVEEVFVGIKKPPLAVGGKGITNAFHYLLQMKSFTHF